MSVTITLYKNFSKKKNSTKQPTSGTTANVVFKDDCSVEAPVFLINGVDLDYNYLNFNGAYYYIDDIVLRNNNIYELHCSKDVLATYKSTIGSLTAFIERSSSAYDVMVNDPVITPTQDIDSYSAATTGIAALYGSGCFVVQVMSQQGITLYACESLTPWGVILNPSSYSASDIVAWIDSKISQSFDLDVYVGSIKWMPMNASTIGTGPIGTLPIGPLNPVVPTTSGNRVYTCNQRYVAESSGTLQLPTSLPYNDFRLCNPRFTQWTGYFPGVGTVDLDSSIFGEAALSNRTITVDTQIDLVSGNICYNLLTGSNNARLGEFNGNVGIDVPLGKASYNTASSVTTLVGGVAAAAASAVAQNYAGAVAAGVSTVVSVADNAVNPQVSVLSGGSGNKGELSRHGSIKISYKAYNTREIPLTSYGRPLYAWRQINALSGFVKCNAASIDIPGEGPDKDAVNSYLNGGFYYE